MKYLKILKERNLFHGFSHQDMFSTPQTFTAHKVPPVQGIQERNGAISCRDRDGVDLTFIPLTFGV